MSAASDATTVNDTIAVIAAIIAALAAISAAAISALFSVANAKRAASQKLAEMRQVWIEDLRSHLTDFVGTIHQILIKGGPNFRSNQESLEKLNANLTRLESYISLKLNHDEDAPKRLVNVLKHTRGAGAHISHGAPDLIDRTLDHLKEIDEVSRFIFKTEWNRASDEIRPVGRKKKKERETKMREWYTKIPDTCTRYETAFKN